MPKKHDGEADASLIRPLREKGLGLHAARAILGWSYRRAQQAALVADGKAESKPPEKPPAMPKTLPEMEAKPSPRSRHITERDAGLERGAVHRFLVGWAGPQRPDETWLENLFSYAEHIGAQLFFGGQDSQRKHYSAEILPFLCTDRVRLSDSLLFIGDPGHGANGGSPIEKYLTMNQGQHVIAPGPRVGLRSIPRMSCFPARYAMSTGAVTAPDYSSTAAGQQALWHHTAAALLVEIDSDGEAFFRQVIAAHDGSFQDMDRFVRDGRVSTGRRVDGIVWGDIHYDVMSRPIGLASFGFDRVSREYVGGRNLLDTLFPEWQVMADPLNFTWRHRYVKDSSTERARQWHLGAGDVRKEVEETAAFINLCRRDWSRIVLVEDNHGRKFSDWVDQDNRRDPLPANARYWALMFARKMKLIEQDPKGYREFRIVEEALRVAGMAKDVRVAYRGESFAPHGVETAIHSHKGINGSPGSPSQFRNFGSRITVTHPHTPLIDQGLYCAGTCASVPEAWDPDATTHANAHVIHYSNGKRCLLTMAADGRYEAVGDRTS